MVLLWASHFARGGLAVSVYRLCGSVSAAVSTMDTQPSSSPTLRNLQPWPAFGGRAGADKGGACMYVRGSVTAPA